MSISIYYEAKRDEPLTAIERHDIAKLELDFSVEDQIAERERTAGGANWTSFFVYNPDDPTAPDVIFEGGNPVA